MRALIVFGFFFISCKSVIGQSTVSDPVENFRSIYDMAGVSKIYKLQVDINNDGRDDMLVLPVEAEINSQYPPCAIYLAQAAGGYVLIGQKIDGGIDPNSVPTFNVKKYKIGPISEISKYGILTLMCGTGGQAKCQLKAIVIEDGGWKEMLIGDSLDANVHYAEMAAQFPNPLTPALVEITPGNAGQESNITR